MAKRSARTMKDHMKNVKPHTKGCEECLKTRRHVGASAHVPGVRPRGLLRFIEEPARARRIFMPRSIR